MTERTVLTYVNALLKYVGVREGEGAPNSGPEIDRWLRAVGQKPGAPWCAAFVNAVGREALGKTYKAPMTAGCAVMGEWAKKKNVLRQEWAFGAHFLMYFPSMKRFAHTGVVLAKLPFSHLYLCVEGNTSRVSGSREGFEVCVRVRELDPAKGHRFVHWWEG